MDSQVEKRRWRLDHAAIGKETDRRWSLITHVVEDAIIEYQNLDEKQATKMRGRPTVTYQTNETGLLQGAEKQPTPEESRGRNIPSKKAAGYALQGNRLINVARRMKANARIRGGPEKATCANHLNAIMMEAYRKQANYSQQIWESLGTTIIGLNSTGRIT